MNTMKKTNSTTLLFLSFWFTILGCSSMPKERPNDFSIRLSDHGGMMPASYSIELNSDTSHVEYYVFKAKNKLYFQLTNQELDSIYQLCRNVKFGGIKEQEEQVYDRGGISIHINANGKNIQKSDAGTSFIQKKHAERFSKVVSMIHQIAQEKTEPLKQKVVVHIEDTLLSDTTLLHFEVNQGGFTDFRFSSEKDGKQKTIEVPFYLGDNFVSVSWQEKGKKAYQNKLLTSNQFPFYIADTTQQLYLQHIEGGLILTPRENYVAEE